MARIENQHYGLWTSFLPDHKPLTLIYQHEEALNINDTHLSFSFCIYSLGSGMKESYMAQNSLELKLSSRSSPPVYAKQRTLSPEQKKMYIKVYYAQLPAGPASGLSPKFLAPAI